MKYYTCVGIVMTVGTLLWVMNSFGAASSRTTLRVRIQAEYEATLSVPTDRLTALPSNLQRMIREFLMGTPWTQYRELLAERIPRSLDKVSASVSRLEPFFNQPSNINKTNIEHPVYGVLSVESVDDPPGFFVVLTHQRVSRRMQPNFVNVTKVYFIRDVIVVEGFSSLYGQHCFFLEPVSGQLLEGCVKAPSTTFVTTEKPENGIRSFFERGSAIPLEYCSGWPTACAHEGRFIALGNGVIDLVARRFIKLENTDCIRRLPDLHSRVLLLLARGVLLFDLEQGCSIACLPLSRGDMVLGLANSTALVVAQCDENRLFSHCAFAVPTRPLEMDCLLMEGLLAAYIPGSPLLALTETALDDLVNLYDSPEWLRRVTMFERRHQHLAIRYRESLNYIRYCIEKLQREPMLARDRLD